MKTIKMTTLKQLVLRQQLTGEDDWSLISEWFVQNDMALEGIKMISKIAQDKIESDDWQHKLLVGDLHMYGATENIMKDFGIKDGCKLNNIITNWIISNRMGERFEEIYSEDIDWLKTFIPTKKRPFIFWNPFLEWMNEKGIYFKDQEKGGEC